MTGDPPSVSAQPIKPKRERKPSKARRNPNAAVLVVVTPDGAFRPVNEAGREICRSRKFFAGIELMAYFYQVRSAEQWRKAHGLGSALIEHVEAFDGLTNSHAALKKLQEDARIACTVERIEIKGHGHLERVVAHSLAFDEMDESEFQEVYGRMLKYVRDTYWPSLDESGMAGLQRLLGMGS